MAADTTKGLEEQKATRHVTLRDVARFAGVSHQTVSRVINQRDEISPATRAKVLEAIEMLGYQPNYLARSLATKVSDAVGLVIPDIANPLFPDIVRGIEDAATPRGTTLLLMNTGDDAHRELRQIDHLRRRRVDGIIVCNSRLPTETLCSLGSSMRIPLVLVSRRIETPKVGIVSPDYTVAARQAVTYLHGLGHRRIGLVYVSSTPHGTQASSDGYRAALEALGLLFDPALVLRRSASIAGGEAAAGALLDSNSPPTAIFCLSDILALGALRACAMRGLNVPKDASVMGWGDLQYAAITSPALTTVSFPLYEMGVKAGGLLLSMAADQEVERLVILPHKLVVRESCGPPRLCEPAASMARNVE